MKVEYRDFQLELGWWAGFALVLIIPSTAKYLAGCPG